MWGWKIKEPDERILLYSTEDPESGTPGKWGHGYLTMDGLMNVLGKIKLSESQNFIDICERETDGKKKIVCETYPSETLEDLIKLLPLSGAQEFYIHGDDFEIHDRYCCGTNVYRIRKINGFGKMSSKEAAEVARKVYAGIFPDECTESLCDQIKKFACEEMIISELAMRKFGIRMSDGLKVEERTRMRLR